MSSFQIIDECLKRNTSSNEDWDSAEYVRIGMNCSSRSLASRVHIVSIVHDCLRVLISGWGIVSWQTFHPCRRACSGPPWTSADLPRPQPLNGMGQQFLRRGKKSNRV